MACWRCMCLYIKTTEHIMGFHFYASHWPWVVVIEYWLKFHFYVLVLPFLLMHTCFVISIFSVLSTLHWEDIWAIFPFNCPLPGEYTLIRNKLEPPLSISITLSINFCRNKESPKAGWSLPIHWACCCSRYPQLLAYITSGGCLLIVILCWRRISLWCCALLDLLLILSARRWFLPPVGARCPWSSAAICRWRVPPHKENSWKHRGSRVLELEPECGAPVICVYL